MDPSQTRADGGYLAPRFPNARLAREWKTIDAMVRLFCRDQHRCPEAICPDCRALLEYAAVRLDRCRFSVNKPTCAKCPVHCYQRDRRDQIKTIMRFSGPKMLWRHPILSLRHWLDSLKPMSANPLPG